MGMRKKTGKYSPVTLVISIATSIILWQIISDYIVSNKFIFPSFTDAVAALLRLHQSGTIWIDVWTSLMHFGIGLILALIIGVPIGICMGWFERVNRFLDPLIEIIRPIPPLPGSRLLLSGSD
jgi:NitT/TauT family transport system permease protein